MRQARTKSNSHCRWLLAACLLVVPAAANAGTVRGDDYQRAVQQAIASLENLQEINEHESPAYYQERFDQTVKTIHETLPEQQSVQSSEEICEVDNDWLHKGLEDCKSLTPEKRAARIAQLTERLRALAQRVAYPQKPPEEKDSKVYTKGKLESILARPEYATEARGPNALTRLVQDFIRWLQRWLPTSFGLKPGGGQGMTIVAEVLVVIVALLVVVYVAKILLGRVGEKRRKRVPKKRKARIVLGEQLQPDDTSTDLLAEAEALARQGQLRIAIRKAYIALLVELGDRRVITLAQHKTNRDYLNSVKNIPVLHSTMRGLTDSFERHWYGFAEATENDWSNFRLHYQQALQAQN